MEPTAAAAALGPPLGTVAGATFYFSPQSTARAEAVGVDAVRLYAAGRGAVLGAVDPEVVDEVAKEIGAEPEAFDAGAFNAKHGLDTAEPSLIVKP